MKKITLSKVISFQGKEIQELHFREPVAGDLKGVSLRSLGEDTKADDLLKIAGNIVEPKLPIGVLESIPIKDFIAITNVIAEYLGN
ncbi:phage tail assembly protein [Candidatus Hepatincola sp. Pdp]